MPHAEFAMHGRAATLAWSSRNRRRSPKRRIRYAPHDFADIAAIREDRGLLVAHWLT